MIFSLRENVRKKKNLPKCIGLRPQGFCRRRRVWDVFRRDKIGIAFEYGDKLGLAFQITDDILDVCGDSQELGKPVGSDVENNKKTFVSLLGIEAAKERAKQLTQQALDLAEGFTDCGFLKELTLELLNRNK